MCVRVRISSCHADYYNRQVRKIKCCPKLSSFIHDVNFMFEFDSIEHLNWYHVELLSKAISRYILVPIWCFLLVYSICYYFGIIWNNLQPFTKKLQRDRLIISFFFESQENSTRNRLELPFLWHAITLRAHIKITQFILPLIRFDISCFSGCVCVFFPFVIFHIFELIQWDLLMIWTRTSLKYVQTFRQC